MSAYLEIDEKDRTMLLHILTERLKSLREEIQHTDTRAYKEGLKVDQAGLQKLIEKVMADRGESAVG